MKPFAVAALVASLAGCALSPSVQDTGGSDLPRVSGASAPDRSADSAPAASAVAPSPAAPPTQSPLVPFSRLDRLDPAGPWADWPFHASKRRTQYRSVMLGGRRVVEAQADSSVSGLRHTVDLDPSTRPILEWGWRIDAVLAEADIGDRRADDSPVRIVLAFDGDVSTLPLKEQMFFERVKLLGGQDMPYATLMYVWCSRRAPGEITENPHTSRVRKIVVESGAGGVRQWRDYRRDIVADYERAFGAKPGRLIAVGVMSDSDNTRQRTVGWYGDIRLLPRETVAASER